MTQYSKNAGRGIVAAAMLILLCTILAGCPPRKPTPVVESTAVLPDSFHAHRMTQKEGDATLRRPLLIGLSGTRRATERRRFEDFLWADPDGFHLG